jgi:proline racemase
MDLVSRALDAYQMARSEMEDAFNTNSTTAIVSAVNRGEKARQGALSNDLEYFVHGIGYTVTLPSGGQVHIDSAPGGDSFSVYDIQQFIETSGEGRAPDISVIANVCEEKVRNGELLAISEWKYLLPRHAA